MGQGSPGWSGDWAGCLEMSFCNSIICRCDSLWLESLNLKYLNTIKDTKSIRKIITVPPILMWHEEELFEELPFTLELGPKLWLFFSESKSEE